MKDRNLTGDKPCSCIRLKTGVTAILALLIMSLPAAHAGPESGTGKDRPVHLGVVAFIGEAVNFHALHKGYFKQEGLNLKVHINPSGKNSLHKLVNGELDICTAETVPVVYNAMKGGGGLPEFKIVASILESSGMNNLVLADVRKTPSVKDLSGKTLALAKGTSSDYSWYMFALMHGIDTSKIKIMDMPVPDMPEAAASGMIDAAVAWTPYHKHILENVSPHGKSIQIKRVYTTNWLVLARPELLNDRPEAVSKYLAALLRSERDFLKDPENVARSHSEYVAQTVSELMEGYSRLRVDLSLTETTLINLYKTAYWAKQNGYAKGPIPDFRSFMDKDPLLNLSPRSVRLLQ